MLEVLLNPYTWRSIITLFHGCIPQLEDFKQTRTQRVSAARLFGSAFDWLRLISKHALVGYSKGLLLCVAPHHNCAAAASPMPSQHTNEQIINKYVRFEPDFPAPTHFNDRLLSTCNKNNSNSSSVVAY